MATGGVCRYTAQLPAEATADGATALTVAGLPQATVGTEYDPHWAYVRDTLAPDDRQHRMLADLALVGVLAEQGDALATPREVEHVAYFPAQDPAEAAAAALRGNGFAAVVERDDEGEFALTAMRRDRVDPPALHELTWSVKETVERHGGTYDGWSCAIAA
jgi:hypothetical protein